MKKFEEPMVDVIAFATENIMNASNVGNEEEVPVFEPPCF